MKVCIERKEMDNLVNGVELVSKKQSSKDLIHAIHFQMGLQGAGDKISCQAIVPDENRTMIAMFYGKMPDDFESGKLYADFYVGMEKFLEAAKKLTAFDSDLVFTLKAKTLELSVPGKASVPLSLVDENMVSAPLPSLPELQKDVIMALSVDSASLQTLAKGTVFANSDIELTFDMEKCELGLQSYNGSGSALGSSKVTVKTNKSMLPLLDKFWRKQNSLPLKEEEGGDLSGITIRNKYPVFPVNLENFQIMLKLVSTAKCECGVTITDKYMTIMDRCHIFTFAFNSTAKGYLLLLENNILCKKTCASIVVDAEELLQALALMSLGTDDIKQTRATFKVKDNSVDIVFNEVKATIPLVDCTENASDTSLCLSEALVTRLVTSLGKGNVTLQFMEGNVKNGNQIPGPIIISNGDLDNVVDSVMGVIMPISVPTTVTETNEETAETVEE